GGANGVVGKEALLRDVKLLATHVVGAGAVLSNCGSVTCDGVTAFGNGQALPIGIESGGRDLPVYAEIDVEVAGHVCRSRSRKDFLAPYERLVARYAPPVSPAPGTIP